MADKIKVTQINNGCMSGCGTIIGAIILLSIIGSLLRGCSTSSPPPPAVKSIAAPSSAATVKPAATPTATTQQPIKQAEIEPTPLPFPDQSAWPRKVATKKEITLKAQLAGGVMEIKKPAGTTFDLVSASSAGIVVKYGNIQTTIPVEDTNFVEASNQLAASVRPAPMAVAIPAVAVISTPNPTSTPQTQEASPQGTPQKFFPAETLGPVKEMHLLVTQTVTEGLIAYICTPQSIPGSGSAVGGGFIRSAMSYQPTSEVIVLRGYSKPIADRDQIIVKATESGLIKKTSLTTGAIRTLRTYDVAK